jgi:glycosyltransferase involved in cell wall biosynthesis
MRILYAITFLHFGAGRSLVELACEAQRRGHEPHIVATRKIEQFESQPILVEEAQASGIPVLLLPDLFTRDLSRVAVSAERVTEVFRTSVFDLIHSHAAIPGFAANLASRQAYGRWLPHVSTVQGWGKEKPAWMKLQDITFLNTVNAIHAVSHDVAQFLMTEGVHEAGIHMIHFGCDFRRVDSLLAAPAKPFWKKRGFCLGTVADLSERKGVHYLIEAVAMLPKEIASNVELVIVGDGPQRDKLMQLAAQMNIGTPFHWVGYQNNPYFFMSQFDLFVLPSLTEGLPVSLVEAMYLKVPVLATDVQGSGEIGGEGRATLVPAKDSRSLAAAIRQIYSDRDTAKQRAAAAYAWVVENFDRNACFDKMLNLYRSVVGARGGSHIIPDYS